MRQALATVLSNTQVMDGVYLMWFGAPEIAQEAHPGQFCMVRCGQGFDPLLRRPLSIHRIGAPHPGSSERGCALLYGVYGAAMEYLRRMASGDTVDIIGPLGRGFAVSRSSRNLLLIAGAWGVAPLVALAEEQVKKGRAVTLLAGASTARQIYPDALLPPEVELVTATDDGSSGHRGPIAELVKDYWSWADEIYASTPTFMYPALAGAVESLWPRKPVQVLAEMPMACGVGACYACVLETKRGPKRSCRDGPRFYLHDLVL